MDRKVSKMVLDGEEFSISEDGKHIKGKNRDYSEEDFHKEEGRKILFLVAPKEVAKDGVVYGFSDEEKMEKWLKEKDLLDKHKEHKELMKKIRRERSPEEREKIKEYQIKFVNKDTENFKKILKEHNLKPEQIQEVEDILKDYDPHFKQKPRSLYLYDYIWFGGAVIKLRGGHQYCGKRYALSYPDLGAFKFDNKANSLILNCGSYAYLYTDKWYGGARLSVYGNLLDLNFFWAHWRNSISSAIVY